MFHTFVVAHPCAHAFLGIAMLLGVWIIIRLVARLVICVVKSFSPRCSIAAYAPEPGQSWAIVTGGSAGIGRAYADEMARAGLNVFLLDRNGEGLAAAKSEIESKFPSIRVETLTVDFVRADQETWDAMRARISSIGDLAVLVNNVGLTVDPPGRMHEVPIDRVDAIVAVNVRTLTLFTHTAISAMLGRQRGRKGLVISMSSFAAKVPIPMLAVYSASKRYVDHLNDALASEYAGRIDFVSAAPWWVATDMTHIKKANWRVISAQRLTSGVMRYLNRSWTSINPYPLHTLLDLIVESAPRFLVDFALIGFMSKVRALYLRRAERERQKAAESRKDK